MDAAGYFVILGVPINPTYKRGYINTQNILIDIRAARLISMNMIEHINMRDDVIFLKD